MPLFVMIARDGPEGAARRSAHRSAHVAHLEALDHDGRIAFAGPIRDQGSDRSVGAVIVFEAASLDEAEALVARDPYVSGEVFETISVEPFRLAFPKPGTASSQKES